MSSLALQVQKLADAKPQQAKKNNKASFLFEARQAADIDLDSLHELFIGVIGSCIVVLIGTMNALRCPPPACSFPGLHLPAHENAKMDLS